MSPGKGWTEGHREFLPDSKGSDISPGPYITGPTGSLYWSPGFAPARLRHITLFCPGDFCQGRKPTEPSSGITGRRTTSESWRDKRALESAGSLYYLSCYIPPVRASCYIEFSSVLALNVQSICSSLGHETCRWVWGRGFHAVWKPKYYESKPRIFVPRQIEVQRKVEVGGGG